MKKRALLHIVTSLAAAMLLPRGLAAEETAKFVPALGWDMAQQSAFPTCIAADAQNAIWVGTEDKGVWRYDSKAKTWTQYAAKDGLGDDHVYAVAVDKLNRVWVGHLNHGVSVWNGEKWKNYGILDGPFGDHVYAIATCPKDGDVWIATDCGLARYSLAKDEWDYFSRASGLPSNQIQCITFDSAGNIYAGTQCDGIAMADAADNYQKWRSVNGPLRMPNAGFGDGLSSPMINALAVIQEPPGMYHDKAEVITAATPLGICETADQGKKWTFLRGADWQANVNGLYVKPESGANAQDPAQPLIGEDWVTCLQQEPDTKRIWFGFRQKGVEARNAAGKQLISSDIGGLNSMLVRAILAQPKTPPLFAVYDDEKGGLKTLENSTTELEPGAEAPKNVPALPASAKAPDAASLSAITKQIGKFKNDLVTGDAVFLGDDWRTGGDWVGRYGNTYTMLCGLESPGMVFAGEQGYTVKITAGPLANNNVQGGNGGPVFFNNVRIFNGGGGGRLFINGMAQDGGGASSDIPHITNANSADPRALYNPKTGHRAEAEAQDFNRMGNPYPFQLEGPDLWVDVTIPVGIHCLSFYFCNNDSEKGHWNKFRDYDLQLIAGADTPEAARNLTPVARARVADFYGGVYKQFIVNGPARYLARVDRNRSYVTKLQGIFLDRLTGDALDKKAPLPGFEKAEYAPPSLADFTMPENKPLLSAAAELWTTLDELFDKRGIIGLQIPLRVWTYRAAMADGAPQPLMENWRWQFALWTPEERKAFSEAMDHAYQAYSAKQNGAVDQPANGGKPTPPHTGPE